MALPPLSGSHTQDSVPSNQTPVDRADKFDQTPVVRSVNQQRNAYTHEDNPEVGLSIAAYIEGMPLTVTYYQAYTSGSTNRASITDITALRDNIDIPLLKITNFEMKVQQGFSLAYDPGQTESQVSGEAVTYPGFNPQLGDAFFYQLITGQLGLFVIDGVEPLSYHNDRLHRLTFHMEQVLTPEAQLLIEDRVVKKTIFDKQIYLSGNRTLLTEDSYLLNQTLIQMKSILVKYYYQEFHNFELQTFVKADGTYDPYVVKFMSALTSFADTKRRAHQLYTRVDETYRYTIWSRLLDNYNLALRDVCGIFETVVQEHTHVDIGVTALLNRTMVRVLPHLRGIPAEEWTDPFVLEGYVLSPAFYQEDSDGMSAFEILVYQAITTRKIADVPGFITTYLDTYMDLTPDEKFYQIPLYIRMIDMARNSLAPNIR